MQHVSTLFPKRWSRRLRIVLVNVVVFLCRVALIEGAVRILNPDIQPLGTDDALIDSDAFGETAGPRPGA